MTSAIVSHPKLDLYELAQQNGDNMRERYERTCAGAGDKAQTVQRFCQQVEREGRVSINTRSARLLSMLRKGHYPNPYEEALERAQREGGNAEDYLMQQQHEYYLKRVTFDRSFIDGESFRYASLNIGGAGLYYYGLYCMVLRAPAAKDPVALLPANSLRLFMNDEPRLDDTSLRREVAPWPHRHHLAACKHAHEVIDTPEQDWPRMMCHANETVESFVEIILGTPVIPQILVEIRVHRDGEARLNELAAKAAMDVLSDPERTELNARLEVFEELEKQQLDSLYQVV